MNNAVHFVGFRGEEYRSAVKVFGKPDFFHRVWDARAVAEVTPDDVVVFSKASENDVKEYTFDDSSIF